MSDTTSEKQQASNQTKEALQESGWDFRAVWEYASDAIALSTADATVFAANPAYFRLYGYSPEDIIGKNFSIIFPPEQRQSAQELYDYIFRSPTISPSFETTVARGDGTERFVEASYNFITDNGTRVAMISIIRDITERKKTEEALRISQLKLHLALEISQMGSWDWDIASNTVRLSANLEAALDLVPGSYEASGATFLELVHPQDRALVEQEVKSTLEEGTDFKVEFRTVTSNGSLRWTRAHGQVLFDEEGKPIRMIGVIAGII
ncbi:MAG: PAS domain-containing protein [Ktedonobacteraceae bacterium]